MRSCPHLQDANLVRIEGSLTDTQSATRSSRSLGGLRNASVRGEGNRPLEDGHAHEPHSFYHYFPRMEQVRAWIADERCRTAASVCSTTTGRRSSAFRSARRSWSRR